ncbi:hypothetical protein chiPu_0019083 [Chiloscyllium punctatum]|uniref:Uncharacterized protein n=1 Tax=Chiloscyllium punctatum TaxID=137246 RepID=A0A401RQL6_CHIPU|nr:hypothetical protein [Chiloscyllium punctatum]
MEGGCPIDREGLELGGILSNRGPGFTGSSRPHVAMTTAAKRAPSRLAEPGTVPGRSLVEGGAPLVVIGREAD